MKNNNTKLNKIQDIMLRQLERLDNQDVMEKEGKEELKRSSAITSTATAFVKTTYLQLKILTSANKNAVDVNELNDYLGLTKSEK